MPRFICESCGTGLYTAALPTRLIDPACPSCGAPFDKQHEADGAELEPVLISAVPEPAHVRPYDGGASLLARHRPIVVRPEPELGTP